MIRRLGAAARTEFGLGLGGGSFYVIGNSIRISYYIKRAVRMRTRAKRKYVASDRTRRENASYLRVGYFLKREKLIKLCDIYRKHRADIEFNYQFDQKDDQK